MQQWRKKVKKKLVVILTAFTMFASGCHKEREVVYAPAPAPVEAPVAQSAPIVEYQQPNDANLAAAAIVGAAATAMIMSNGMHYDGYHWYGPAPHGYYSYGGRLYRDTPYVHRYARSHRPVVINKTVVNKTVINKTVVNNVSTRPNNPVPSVSTPVAPVANNLPANPVKVKNPGDAAADAEKAKMKVEQAQKAQQADLKARLQAKQAQRAQAAKIQSFGGAAPKSSGGFNTMSRSASSMRNGRR